MSLGEVIGKAILNDSILIDEMVDSGICPDCKGLLDVISDNVGTDENPKDEFRIVCTECGKDWSQGSNVEYLKG